MRATEAGRGDLQEYRKRQAEEFRRKIEEKRAREIQALDRAVGNGIRITVSVKPGEARAVAGLAKYIRAHGVPE